MMVARNLGMQDIPYARMLLGEDKMEYITLEELKPSMIQSNVHHGGYQPTYYELTNVVEHENPCSSSSGGVQYQCLDSCAPSEQHQQHVVAPSLQYLPMAPCPTTVAAAEPMPVVDSTLNPPLRRKRKASFQSDADDDTGEDSKSAKTDDNKKQNHSEIEKRRRDKMNTYITELSSMIPMCHAMSRKLDKLTVLRMAVQHMKTIRGNVNSYTEGHYKPSFLSDQELKQLILQIADGFLFVVGCDRGRILYMSESVSKVLNYSQSDLLGQSLFDILHPKDVAKVKEQLSSSDLNPRERLIDAKTMLPVKTDMPQGASRMCPGARRSFFCRMKCKISQQVKEEADTTTGYHRRKSKLNSDKKFSVIQCTGYLKCWAPAKIGIDDQDQEMDGGSCNLSCLVAIGRTLPHISSIALNNNQSTITTRPIQFVSRHALDGKFIFVDQRATLVLGFLPQELLGTSMYEYYHQDDIHSMAERHKMALQTNDYVITNAYRFRTKDDTYLRLQSEFKAFTNPWTKEIEYLIAKNNLVLSDFRIVESTASRTETLQESFNDFFSSANGKDIQNIINTHVEASKIGRQIAEQVNDLQRSKQQDSSCTHSTAHTMQHVSSNNESNISTSMQSSDSYQSGLMMADYGQQQQQALFDESRFTMGFAHLPVPHSQPTPTDSGLSSSGSGAPVMMNQLVGGNGGADEGESPQQGGPGPQPSMDGNDEAAMAVIMSLLEADAGLGGPVDFSGLPWPLP